MKHALTLLAVLLFGPLAANAELERDFANPPGSAKPHAFWYWMNGSISREGITADLEAMRRAGLGGAMIFNIGGHGPEGPVKVLSPEWRELMKHAIRKAGELGIEVNLNNSMAGWSSSGGPWITPELAMQKVVWSETRVPGGERFEGALPQPTANLGYYRDIAVLAFPTPRAEAVADPLPAVSSSDAALKADALLDGDPATLATLAAPPAGQPRFLQFQYPAPAIVRSLHITPREHRPVPKGRLLASADGRQWREVLAFPQGRNRAPLDAVVPETAAPFWRLEFEAAGELTLAEVRISPRYRIGQWTGKAMFDYYGLDRPPFSETALAPPADCVVAPDRIVDLSAQTDETGKLTWEAPPGEWTVLRFGHTPTGAMTGPAGRDGGGLDCDKFSRQALEAHWAASLQPWFDDPELNRLVQYVHVDSYERGAQNWTARFPEEFGARRGYDLRRWLPALTGRVIGGLRDSERFLWDFRQVCCGLMAENYYGHMRELCRRAGKRFTCEPYHQTQFVNVSAGGQADVPMCEAWMGPSIPGPYWMKLGASPGHVYGRPIIGAEAFTAPGKHGGNWSTDFWDMKPLGDALFCGGVNRLYFHVYVHQPWPDQAPGWTLAVYGTHFERSNTWWEQMPAFTRYLSRCQHLLQQGQFVADALYSVGENAPNESDIPEAGMTLPRGYDYDVCDPQTILTRLTVRDGRLCLPDGMSYRLLVLPKEADMTPAMLRRLGDLVAGGATVVAARPVASPSLAGQPGADEEVRSLAAKLWSGGAGTGRILAPRPMAEILASLGVAPDCDSARPLRYIHRRLPDGELYFLAQDGDQVCETDVRFRVAGLAPELWDPLTGGIRHLAEYRHESGRTVVPLRFEPRQSYFVVFRKPRQESEVGNRDAGKNFPEVTPVAELGGGWTVTFDPKWGGPVQPVIFDALDDWSKRPEPGIKYYSGKATYRKVFDLRAAATNPAAMSFLDLGEVKNLAEVRLNGKDLGVVWCAPWRVDITGVVRAACNELEIAVVNLWPNRLIGDEQLPADCEWGSGDWILLKRWPDWLLNGTPRPSGRRTFTTFKHWHKHDPLLPSGLLGPVTLQAAGKTNTKRMHTP